MRLSEAGVLTQDQWRLVVEAVYTEQGLFTHCPLVEAWQASLQTAAALASLDPTEAGVSLAGVLDEIERRVVELNTPRNIDEGLGDWQR